MKKSNIALAVAATAVSSSALAFDNTFIGGDFNGFAPFYFHSLHQIGVGYCNDALAPGGDCSLNPTPTTETQTVLRTTSGQIDSSGNLVGPPINNGSRTLTCGNPADFGNPYAPNAFHYLAGWNYSQENLGATQNQALGTVGLSWGFPCTMNLGAKGQITGGLVIGQTVNPANGEPINYFNDYTRGWNVIFRCEAGIITNYETQVVPFITSWLASGAPAASVPSPYLAGGSTYSCELSNVQEIRYNTCDVSDECGQFGKSVPVPAFAAGALGLGLLGVTYLTSRRRTVK